MQIGVAVLTRYMALVAGVALLWMGCSQSTTLTQDNRATSGKAAVLKILLPTAQAVETATQKHRSYDPSGPQVVWVESIDGQPVSEIIKPGQDPRKLRELELAPGKHRIAFRFEGAGTSVRYIPMFEDSVGMTFEYKSWSRKPVVLEVDLKPGQVYQVQAHARVGECEVSLLQDEKVVARETAPIRYRYSNVFDPKNWHLNSQYISDQPMEHGGGHDMDEGANQENQSEN
ncbi:MAG: hypothetical protein D6681_14970 [Calditrichaeota bacterium]|nr:MAG: hypothetical protein D6681_14970 [Calditrichota bacterium]